MPPFFAEDFDTVVKLNKMGRIGFEGKEWQENPVCRDLIRKMLEYDKNDRWSVEEC